MFILKKGPNTLLKRLMSSINYSKDYYKVLNANSEMSSADLRKAYIAMAKKYHPDTPTGNTEKFKQIAEAWEVLGNDSLRKEYDSGRAAGKRGTEDDMFQRQRYQNNRSSKNYQNYTYYEYYDPFTRKKTSFYSDGRNNEDMFRHFEDFFKQQKRYEKQQRREYEEQHRKEYEEQQRRRYENREYQWGNPWGNQWQDQWNTQWNNYWNHHPFWGKQSPFRNNKHYDQYSKQEDYKHNRDRRNPFSENEHEFGQLSEIMSLAVIVTGFIFFLYLISTRKGRDQPPIYYYNDPRYHQHHRDPRYDQYYRDPRYDRSARDF